MILDGLLLFDSANAITTTEVSTNVIDLANFRDMGVGDDPAMKLMVQVVTAFLTTDSATLTVAFQGSTDNSTYTDYALSRAYTAGELTAANRLFDIDLPRPSGGAALPRYLRLNYTVGTGSFTAGAVTSALVLDRQSNRAYPAGINVTN